MNIPEIDCKIEVFCPVNPSEDPDKIRKAVSNILPYLNIDSKNFSISSQSEDLRCLEKIYETIHTKRSQKIYRRNLEKNLKGNNNTWFYLNKQAAYAGKIVICENSDESPLGPIKIILISPEIDRIISWFTQ